MPQPILGFFFNGTGGPEMILVGIVVLILFGAKGLPDFARNVGKIMFELRKASNDFKSQLMEVQETVRSETRELETSLIEATNEYTDYDADHHVHDYDYDADHHDMDDWDSDHHKPDHDADYRDEHLSVTDGSGAVKDTSDAVKSPEDQAEADADKSADTDKSAGVPKATEPQSRGSKRNASLKQDRPNDAGTDTDTAKEQSA